MTLPNFEGRDVVASRIKVMRSGDGLLAPLDIEPVVLHHGEEVWLLLRTEVVDVSHPEVKPGFNELVRTHKLVAQDVTIQPASAVADLQNAERDRIAKLREEREGVLRLVEEEADDA